MIGCPYEMHMFVFSWDPALGFMQYLEHLKFLEYLLGVEHEGGRNENDRDQFLMSSKIESKCVN